MEICQKCKKPITESKWESASVAKEDGVDSYFHRLCWEKEFGED